jgi:hypothetical protein
MPKMRLKACEDMEKEKGKNQSYTTIQVTIETYDKLHSVQQQLGKVLRKKTVSFDVMFKLFFVCQPLDLILQDLILEQNPSIAFDKKPKKHEEETEE